MSTKESEVDPTAEDLRTRRAPRPIEGNGHRSSNGNTNTQEPEPTSTAVAGASTTAATTDVMTAAGTDPMLQDEGKNIKRPTLSSSSSSSESSNGAKTSSAVEREADGDRPRELEERRTAAARRLPHEGNANNELRTARTHGNHRGSGTDMDGAATESSGSGSSSAQQPANATNGESPVRRIPPVLRPPPGSSHLNNSTSVFDQPAGNLRSLSREYELHQLPQRSAMYSSGHHSGGMPLQAYGGASASASNVRGHQAYYPHAVVDPDNGRTFANEMMNHPPPTSMAMMSPMQGERHMPNRDGGPPTTIGMKRRLASHEHDMPSRAYGAVPHPPELGASSNVGSNPAPPARKKAEDDDPLRFETRGSHGPRDETRYETWTSKQLRKKCSHLKLRGLKNVKKHVMVEALYRYYRNLRQKEAASGNAPDNARGDIPQRAPGAAESQSMAARDGNPPPINYRPRQENAPTNQDLASYEAAEVPQTRARGSNSSQSDHTTTSSNNSSASSNARKGGNVHVSSGAYRADDEAKHDFYMDDIQVTSDDVIRLVDVVLSPDFVDRLAAELSRWQFWVDVREKYSSHTLSQPMPHAYGGRSAHGDRHMGDRSMIHGATSHSAMMKKARFSSMQLWEIWKELTFAYTKTCFEFTAAGMRSADERDYIKFCEGRPDVYYLHQRLHARPDLLHLIKSNEYIDEKCTSDASESIAAAVHGNLAMATTSPSGRPHKRYKRLTQPSEPHLTGYPGSSGSGSNGSGANTNAPRPAEYHLPNGTHRGPSPTAREEGSTENSETTGEEGSSDRQNGNASQDTCKREALAEQRYFGLLLQNFEAIFESLHNKKILLAALRKDTNAPDHLIADLHDDIHVLSALKKEFRNKLRGTLG